MNLMQYLSVGGALESPREKHFSRRIGSKKSEPAEAVARESARMEPVIQVEPSRLEDDQGEFGFIEPLEIDRSSQAPGNHLDLKQEEAKPKADEQVEVHSRITPTRVRVVRNDLVGSDIALRESTGVDSFRPSLIAEEPQRTSFFDRMKNRFGILSRMTRFVGLPKGGATKVRPVAAATGETESVEGMSPEEFQEAIELARDYKTDVYVNGQVAWSYAENAEKANG